MKTVFFDVDTQLDFMYPGGALYGPGGEQITGSLAALTRYALANRIQIISSADKHAEDDPEFADWKPHCVAGTVGQQKASITLSTQPLILASEPGALDEIRSRVADAQQIIVEKQHLDAFSNLNLRPLLDILDADGYVLYGLFTDVCVRCAAFGLLETGRPVELVSDAIKSLSESEGREVIGRFQAQGGQLTTVSRITR